MKYSVLTYIIGNYEVVREIEFNTLSTPDVEYLLVTDNKDLKSDTWKVIYDQDLDNPNLTPFDRTFMVRYNLFKYAKNDICVRFDHSYKLRQPLDTLVEKFELGKYDACLNIHVGRNNILEEYYAWVEYRNFDPNEALKHILLLNLLFKYDFNIKGLYEQSFSINRRNEWTSTIDKDMLYYLKVFNLDNKHITRLDQTIFSAYINTFQHNKKYMFVDNYALTKKLFDRYQHGLNGRKYKSSPSLIEPYFNNELIDIIDI